MKKQKQSFELVLLFNVGWKVKLQIKFDIKKTKNIFYQVLISFIHLFLTQIGKSDWLKKV